MAKASRDYQEPALSTDGNVREMTYVSIDLHGLGASLSADNQTLQIPVMVWSSEASAAFSTLAKQMNWNDTEAEHIGREIDKLTVLRLLSDNVK